MIDLRSDTVTKPSLAMREAMARAEVGDDVYGEDPTVNKLEEKAAALLGKEAAIFVPTGTMGNQMAIRLHTRSGDEIIAESNSHIFIFEAAGPASLSGVQVRCVPGNRGILEAAKIEEAIRGVDDHFPETTLICLENSHNRGGGSVYTIDRVRQISELARKRGIKMHLDGARLFNAVSATGTSAAEYAKHFDTVSFCLSKGLGAPVGSLVCSSRENVRKLRRIRKMFGGGMRQAGIIAAAGLYAIEHNIERLKHDHQNAKLMAELLSKTPGISMNPSDVETNLVIFEIARPDIDAHQVVTKAKAQGVLMLATSNRNIRAVTHLDVNEGQVREACALIAKAVQA